MELYYFLSGLQVAAIGFILYQFRSILRNQRQLNSNYDAASERLQVNTDSLNSVMKKMSEDNYVDASQMNSNLGAHQRKLQELESNFNSLAKKHENLQKKTDNDKLELIQNLRKGVEQMTTNRSY